MLVGRKELLGHDLDGLDAGRDRRPALDAQEEGVRDERVEELGRGVVRVDLGHLGAELGVGGRAEGLDGRLACVREERVSEGCRWERDEGAWRGREEDVPLK